MEAKIKPQDLRTTSLFVYEGEIHEVGALYRDALIHHKINDDTECFHSRYDEIEGVPLTEDILVRLGFELIVWNGVIKQYYIEVQPNNFLSLRFGEYKGYPDRLDRVFIGSGPERSGSTYALPLIASVHEIQNLFYSLSGGTELTLNP